ncbi:hypothetical protein DID88_009659 [Monilinia fructigena]|uniref:Uncharacterized protein n=1 Tax=Monilinia fructigena TaxID=38457 RepID=A0A395IMU6_9HELO|nr:hypothetical protein DID88_009659 [Monilinia fructigena]
MNKDRTDNFSLTEARVPIKTSGTLIPLKTTLETRSRDSLLGVYITHVPAKKASGVLDLTRKLLPNDGGYDLQHIRRFAKQTDVPDHVRDSLLGVKTDSNGQADTGPPELFLLVGAMNLINLDELRDALSPILDPITICSINVPLLAPTSQEQAKLWSSQYWPIVYKKSNPFGPHPAIVSRAEIELQKEPVLGSKIGAVVVQRKNGVAHTLAIAGDSRWLKWPRVGSGNVTAHAALRAIAMVADGIKIQEEKKGSTVLKRE